MSDAGTMYANAKALHELLQEERAENAKLRELVRGLVYATHPADRARLIADATELGVEA